MRTVDVSASNGPELVEETARTEEVTRVTAPVVSVVMPTYNRLDRLRRALHALAAQTVDPEVFEVIVVSDGSTDGTDDFLAGAAPLPVTSVRQDNAGPAAARNRGWREARGRIVLFLDDDVIASPGLIERHVRHHADDSDTVVIGPMLDAGADFRYSPWVAWEQAMLHKQYGAMRRGDWAPSFRQFYTGNVSLPRTLLERSGGFDTFFLRAEDVELAFRLDALGVRWVFDETAEAFHFAERSLASWLATASAYGRNDIRFIRDHDHRWLVDGLAQDFANRNRLTRVLVLATLDRPRVAQWLIRAFIGAARVAGRVTNGVPTRQLLSAAYGMAYYRGAAEEIGDPRELERLLGGGGMEAPPRVGFVLEQTLGHVTHADNLRAIVPDLGVVDPVFAPIAFDVRGWAARVPGFRNWTVRAGWRTRRAIARLDRGDHVRALFVHTQVLAVLGGRRLRRIPTIVSLDATPLQYDSLGDHYAHGRSSDRVERWKWRLNRRCFARAAHLVAWSDWTAESLVRDYGVDRERISVIAPGVHLDRWRPASGDAARRTDDPVRVLFVGGDLHRKGGDLLIAAAAMARQRLESEGGPQLVLDLVTRDDVSADEHTFVHHGMRPNSPELVALYRSAHLFCLPTLGDCLPMVLSEAGAAELPLVSTDVGAIREIVRDGETGLLVPVGAIEPLADALVRLASDPALRRRLGLAAAALVGERYDATANARQLAELLADLAKPGVI